VHELDKGDFLRLEDPQDLSGGGVGGLFEEVHADGEAVEGDLHLSEGLEVEGIEVHEVDEHAAAQTHQRSIDRYVLHRVDHDDKEDHEAQPHHQLSYRSHSRLQPLIVAGVDDLHRVMPVEVSVETISFEGLRDGLISVDGSAYQAVDTLCLLDLQQVDHLGVLAVLGVDVDDADDDGDGHCNVKRLASAVDHEGNHDLYEDRLPVLEVHHQVAINCP
jgi:hypothetical protein